MNRVRFSLTIHGMGHMSQEFTEEELAARYPEVEGRPAFYLRVVKYLDAWRAEHVEACFEFEERD